MAVKYFLNATDDPFMSAGEVVSTISKPLFFYNSISERIHVLEIKETEIVKLQTSLVYNSKSDQFAGIFVQWPYNAQYDIVISNLITDSVPIGNGGITTINYRPIFNSRTELIRFYGHIRKKVLDFYSLNNL